MHGPCSAQLIPTVRGPPPPQIHMPSSLKTVAVKLHDKNNFTDGVKVANLQPYREIILACQLPRIITGYFLDSKQRNSRAHWIY